MSELHGEPPLPEGGPERISALQAALIEPIEDRRRAEIHFELGRLALREGEVERAVRHFREALHLDPRLELARRRLEAIGASVRPGKDAEAGPRRRGLFGRFKR